MTRLMKHAAVLMVLIVVALCMPLCGMAADYTAGSTTVFYYNENADVMIALLGETIDSYEGMSEFKHDWDGDGTITA